MYICGALLQNSTGPCVASAEPRASKILEANRYYTILYHTILYYTIL